jgi:predicted RNase H-like nuclease
MLEVYPHAGHVALFDLPTILKYKKGTVAQKSEGLTSLQGLIRRLTTTEPALQYNAALNDLLSRKVSDLRGDARKRYEDVLDAVFAAYLAYYYWYWRGERTEVFGDLTFGYILNPKLLRSALNKPAA